MVIMPFPTTDVHNASGTNLGKGKKNVYLIFLIVLNRCGTIITPLTGREHSNFEDNRPTMYLMLGGQQQ